MMAFCLGDENGGSRAYKDRGVIHWLDAPGFAPLTKKALAPEGVRYSARFEAIVSGDLGTCGCTWNVEIAIDEKGKVHQNEVLNKKCWAH